MQDVFITLQLWGAPVGADDRRPAEEGAATSCQVQALCSRLNKGLMSEGDAQFLHVRMSAAQPCCHSLEHTTHGRDKGVQS